MRNYIHHPHGMGSWVTDAWNALVGKPQSWYTNLSNIQSQLSVVLAGVTAVGSDLWNTVSSAAGSGASGIFDYGSIVSDIDARMRDIIVTTNHVPTEQTIAGARAAANQYQGQLAFVKAMAPEVAGQIDADQQAVESMLPGPMVAPAAAGREAFEQELAARAKALGQGLMDWTQYLAIGLGAAAVLYVASQASGKRSAA